MIEMATRNKITEIIAGIKTMYPYYAKDTNTEMLVRLWEATLKDYANDVVENAFMNSLRTCTMPPTPADVIKHINMIFNAQEMTESELWVIYCEALRQTIRNMNDFAFTFVEANGLTQGENARHRIDETWNSLPEKIKIYLANKSELMRKAKEFNEGSAPYEQNYFYKALPQISERLCYVTMLSNNTFPKIGQGDL